MIQNLKNNYTLKVSQLKKNFLREHNNKTFLRAHTFLVDSLLKQLWKKVFLRKGVALIAVGGYGRKELYPYSDIDILLLHKENLPEKEFEKITSFITLCWDLGLKIGHSTRDINQCIDEFKKDIRTATNLLETRVICGSKILFKNLESNIFKQIKEDEFYHQKLTEQTNRHKKYRGSAYQLEPNVKESPGGLRDLHNVIWIATSQKKGRTFRELLQNNVINLNEYNKVNFHLNRITKRRILLHLLASSAEDRLVFDLQNKLASHLGYTGHGHHKASEMVMKSYYKSVNYIILFNEIVTKRLNPKPQKKITIRHELPFFVMNNLLEIDEGYKENFIQHIFEPFLIFQGKKNIHGFGPNLLGLLDSSSKLINQSIRKNSFYQNKILQIFTAKNKVNRALRLLNKTNILGKFIPAFGKVVAQMQHDLFHIYTVDEHTLNVIENIRRYSKDKLKHEFPECHEVFKSFRKPYLLYFAAFFHDIGKGQGGDHSIIGEKIAATFCRRMQFDKKEMNLITWLVRSHLTMSQVAQKKDISNPQTIKEFANFVQTKTKLKALYLLTGADIRGTSPAVWNQWKASLLKDLFYQTYNYLDEQLKDAHEIIKIRKQNVLARLNKSYSINSENVRALWHSLGDEYFYRFDEHDIIWHSRVLLKQFHSRITLVKTRHAPDGNGIEVLIFRKESENIFIKSSQFFALNNFDVMQAKIFTTKDDFALDVFNILMDGKNVSYKHLFEFIEKELTKILNANFVAIDIPSNQSRQAMHHKIESSIEFKKIKGGYEFSITTDSRKGLLFQLSNIINTLNLSIEHAKINTLGNRVEDSFILQAKHGVLTSETIKKLSENIQEKLGITIAI